MELPLASTSTSADPTAHPHTQSAPPEVPLRATQASKEMRKMMTVFRVDPFSFSTGDGKGATGAGAAWYAEGVGPLESEGVLLEFQLDVGDPDPRLDETELTSFEPAFEPLSTWGGEDTDKVEEGTAILVQAQMMPQSPPAIDMWMYPHPSGYSSPSESMSTTGQSSRPQTGELCPIAQARVLIAFVHRQLRTNRRRILRSRWIKVGRLRVDFIRRIQARGRVGPSHSR
jgi:hypothetical protein